MTIEERNKWFSEMWQPTQWANTAANLFEAANLLFSLREARTPNREEPLNPEYDHMDLPATLLYGYAVENAAKAYVLKTKNLNPAQCKEFPGWKDHDLVMLFDKIDFQLTKEERMLLKTLTAHILWAGKYPAAFEETGNRGFFIPEQYEHGHSGSIKNSTPKTFDEVMRYKLDPLFKRLLDECKDDSVQIIKGDACQPTETD